MVDGREFMEFIFKVDVESLGGENKVGTGGARRPDGTLSGQAYDPRPIPPQPGKPNVQIIRAGSGGVPPWVMGVIEQVAVRLGTLVIEEYAVPAATKLWNEKLSPAARKRRAQAQAETPVPEEESQDEPARTEIVVALEETEAEASESTDVDVSSQVTMSREEAQWHADTARAAFEVFMEHASALRNARIIDDEGVAELTVARDAVAGSESPPLERGADGTPAHEAEAVPLPVENPKPRDEDV